MDKIRSHGTLAKHLIYEYKHADVDNRDLLKVYARGSSRKQKIDVNNKLVIFFLHRGAIYSWTQFDAHSCAKIKINFVSQTCSTEFYMHSTNQFYYMIS